MRMPQRFEDLAVAYPYFSKLELHFFNLKYCGVKDKYLKESISRPIFEIWDNYHLAEIDFLVSDEDSPYEVQEERLLFRGEEFQLDHVLLDRSNLDMPYSYIRGPLGGDRACPTLDDENLLNLNHHQCCSGCDFCAYGERSKNKQNQSVREIITESERKNPLASFKQVAFVTGCFPSEQVASYDFIEAIKVAKEKGFNGNFLYIGSQITDEKLLEEVIKEIGDVKKWEYAYTLERFTHRMEIMHGIKGKRTIKEMLEDLKRLKEAGIEKLQYTYLVGIEDLEDLKYYAEDFVPYATPHFSIFRKSGLKSNARCYAQDYLRMGASYTCEVRNYFKQIYGKEILGNNLANLWLFPRSRVDGFFTRLKRNKELLSK